MKHLKLTMNRLEQYLKSYNISEELTSQIVNCGKLHKIKSFNTLVSIGDYVDDMFYVTQGGFISQHFDEKSEKEKTTNFYLPKFQRFFSVTESYFEKKHSTRQIKAFTESEVIVFKKTYIMSLVNSNEIYREFYYNNIINTWIEKENLMSKMITLESKSLYKTFVKEYPEIIRHVPSKYIAEFMGVTPQWLSKIKRSTISEIS